MLAKPTPLNINLGSDRFAMFNKVRDIPGNNLIGDKESLCCCGQMPLFFLTVLRRYPCDRIGWITGEEPPALER